MFCPQSNHRRSKYSETSKQNVKARLEKLLTRKNADAMSVRTTAQKVGISYGTFWSWFPNIARGVAKRHKRFVKVHRQRRRAEICAKMKEAAISLVDEGKLLSLGNLLNRLRRWRWARVSWVQQEFKRITVELKVAHQSVGERHNLTVRRMAARPGPRLK